MEFDLHTHTKASDGKLRPKELVALAKDQGLQGLAITDHDTVDGIAEGLAAARQYGVEVLPGVELSASFRDLEIHILGYFIDWEEIGFLHSLSAMSQERQIRAQKILERLSQLGFPLDFDEVKEIAGEGVIGRPHLADAMVRYGYAKDLGEAFNRFLGKGALAYIPRQKIPLEGAVELIKQAKGIPVLAHPGLIGHDQIIPMLIGKGLMGIEVHYPEHTSHQKEYYRNLCNAYGLIPTGGSDFHGDSCDLRLGIAGVEYPVIRELKRKREELYA